MMRAASTISGYIQIIQFGMPIATHADIGIRECLASQVLAEAEVTKLDDFFRVGEKDYAECFLQPGYIEL